MEKIKYMNGVFLYGASGHAKVIIEIAELNDIPVLGLFDADNSKTKLLGYKINEYNTFPKNSNYCISIGNNLIRKKIAEKNSLNFINLFHPNSSISRRTKIGIGTVIMAGVSINSSSIIGKHCIINTNSSIDHDCSLDDYVHISPNAALAGNVTIGEGTHVGMGASIIQGIKIGKWCTIGAGAVIIQDIPDGATVVGNPGKIIKINNHND